MSEPRMSEISDEMVTAYRDAWAALPVPSTPAERVRAGLAAVEPLLRDAVLREAYWALRGHAAAAVADRDRLRAVVLHAAAECHRRKWAYEGEMFEELHQIGELLRPAAFAPTTAVVPGSSRRAQECSQACTEGHQYDETCELGSSRRAPEPDGGRSVSATAIRSVLYDALSPNFEIDSDGYDDAAVAVAKLVDALPHIGERPCVCGSDLPLTDDCPQDGARTGESQASEPDRRRHNLAFNAITQALPRDRFVSLSERAALADAVLAALDGDSGWEIPPGAHGPVPKLAQGGSVNLGPTRRLRSPSDGAA